MKSFVAATVAASIVAVASAKKCQNITVPVTISGRNGKFDQAALTPHSNIDVTNFILNLAEQGTNYTAKTLKGYSTVSGTYKISSTYCAPDSGAPDVVQVLTHGIGFDRSYWDLSYNNYNYSYVSEAVDEYGFATFSYDRLGIGQSQHGEPVNEIQTALEVAALKALTDGLRAGSIKASELEEWDERAVLAETGKAKTVGDARDLAELCRADFIQANKNPALAQYPDGYLAPASPSAVQTNFFAPGDFDPKILPVAFSTGEPVTIGELLTIGGAAGAKNPIKAPVLIITGERDIPFCGGNCLAPPTGFSSVPETSKAMLPNASPFKVHIVKGAGHGLNLQYTHKETYGTLLNFFVQNGVGPKGSHPASPTGPPSGPGGYGNYGGYGKYGSYGTY